MRRSKSNVVAIPNEINPKAQERSDTNYAGRRSQNVIYMPYRFMDYESINNSKSAMPNPSSTQGDQLESDDESLIDHLLSLSSDCAIANFDALRPRDVSFNELLTSFLPPLPDSCVQLSIAANRTYYIDSILSAPNGIVMMPYGDLRSTRTSTGVAALLEFDRTFFKTQVDEFGFMRTLKSPDSENDKRIIDECSKRVKFFEHMHFILFRAAKRNTTVKVMFVDFDKYQWAQRDNQLICNDDLVYLDSEPWHVEHQAGKFQLVRDLA